MSYSGISIREALDRVNSHNNGWYLPQVQRQYVWGARHQSETYICLLLDSLLKRYPIGGIVLWETDREIPFREFITNYVPGEYAKQADKGKWSMSKSLVYDGQQRLQTLFSVLRYKFNDRVLHFDLLFDKVESDADETGFFFRDANAADDPRYIRMTELSHLQPSNESERIKLENKAKPAAEGSTEVEILVRANLSALLNVFVDTNHKAIAYFSVRSDKSTEVNEVFRRLNTGGIALTQLELVLSKIKAIHSDYEERLWALSEKIKKESGGIDFPSSSVLQFLHLIVKDTLRIDEERLVASEDIEKFNEALEEENTKPLVEVFTNYLKVLFNINNAAIIPRWLAILPIAAYMTIRKRKTQKWQIHHMSTEELQLIHQYFLLSQFCDWNTQTMVNGFSRLAIKAAEEGGTFPLEGIRELALKKNRPGDLKENQLLDQPWFATKILTPHRSYVFEGRTPQVDHIFPYKLKGEDEKYQKAVDCLWNFQPMPANVNRNKSDRHPKIFFESEDGKKYRSSYDFIPEPYSPLWDNPYRFIDYRRSEMLKELETRYGLNLSP